MKKCYRILAAALFLVLLATVGCNMNEDKEINFDKQANAEGVPAYDSAEEFTLGAWYSPDAKEELWKWLKESNLNEVTIFPANIQSEEYLKAALGYCRQFGIRAHIYLMNTQKLWGKDWTELLEGYGDVISGFDVWDEPNLESALSSLPTRPDLEDLVPNIEYVLDNFPGTRITNTLWPNYATDAMIGLADGETYEDYVKAYCERIVDELPAGAERWVGTDFYPYYVERFDGGLLSNLEVLQYYGKEVGADVYLYIQTMNSQKLNWRKPNRAELSLQYYTALAYGVRNIQMFCYQQPKQQGAGEYGYEDGEAMITDGFTTRWDDDGNLLPASYERTQIYYDVQSLNAEVLKLSEAYMDFEWKGVLTSFGTKNKIRDDFSKLKYTLKAFDGLASCTSEENMIVGCFRDGEGNDGYLVTNYGNPVDLRDSRVDLDFGDRTRAIVYKGGERYLVNLIGGHYITTLSGGEGHFVVPVA